MPENNYATLRCQLCGGNLIYDAGEKRWRCKYCRTFVDIYQRENNDVTGIVRQVLLDVANGNLEKAEQNLSDCERKNHTSIGTLIARISWNLAGIASSSGAAQRACLSNVKTYMTQFLQNYSQMGPEETDLYNSFGEDSADIFANLICMFDTMNQNERVGFCVKKLDASGIRSSAENLRLLRIAIRREMYDLTDKIVSNSAFIDHSETLCTILKDLNVSGGEAADRKKSYITKLADKEGTGPVDQRFFAQYFEENGDPADVKLTLLKSLKQCGIRLDTKRTYDAFKEQCGNDGEIIKEVLEALYSTAVPDSETIDIIGEALVREGTDGEYLCGLLSFFDERHIYTAVNSRILTEFLGRSDLSGEEKIQVLEGMRNFPIDNAVKTAVFKNYLCNITVDGETGRKSVLDFFLAALPSVPTQAMQQYVQRSTADGPSKPGIIKLMLDHGFKPSFARELLGNYLRNCPDTADTENAVFDVLLDAGFQVDPKTLNDYMAGRKGSGPQQGMSQKEVFQKLLQGGSDPPQNALDQYLRSVKNQEEFDPELINLLKSRPFYIQPETYQHYLLDLRDPARVQNNTAFVAGMQGAPGGLRIRITMGGSSLETNILQAYLLLSREPYEIMNSVAHDLISAGVNLKEDVLENNSRVRFRKFVKNAEQNITQQAMAVFTENRVFSLF